MHSKVSSDAEGEKGSPTVDVNQNPNHRKCYMLNSRQNSLMSLTSQISGISDSQKANGNQTQNI